MSTTLAPRFTAAHVAGHQVSLGDFAGRTVVVVLTNKDSADQARDIARAIRTRYTHDALPIISVADISGAPRAVRGVVRGLVKRGYTKAAEEYAADLAATGQPQPGDMARALIMVTDTDGSIVGGFGHAPLGSDAVAVVVDGNGVVVGQAVGAAAGAHVLSLLG